MGLDGTARIWILDHCGRSRIDVVLLARAGNGELLI